MGDDSRTIRLRGVRVHNLKGVDLDLPLHRLVAFSGRQRVGQEFAGVRHALCRGATALRRDLLELYPAVPRTARQARRRPDRRHPAGHRRGPAVGGTAIGPEHGRDGLRGPRPPGLALCQGRQGHLPELRHERRAGRPLGGRPGHRGAARRGALPRRLPVRRPPRLRPRRPGRSPPRGRLHPSPSRRRRSSGWTTDPLPIEAGGGIDVVVDRLTRGSEAAGRRLDSIETAFAKGLGRCPDRGGRRTAATDVLPEAAVPRLRARLRRPRPSPVPLQQPARSLPDLRGVRVGRRPRPDPDRPRPLEDHRAKGPSPPGLRRATRTTCATCSPSPRRLGLPVDVPFSELSPAQVALIYDGVPRSGFQGLRKFFRRLESKSYKMHVRVFLSRWRGYRPCPDCRGARLRPEALAVRVGGLDIAALSRLTIRDARTFLAGYAERRSRQPGGPPGAWSRPRSRLDALDRIGLDYLTLDRPARTLSSGEARRLALTSALGSGLVNTLYVLDEPSVGLHPRDVGRLIATLEGLRDAGNSVVVVEHDEAILQASDWLVDIGPGAGDSGGRVLYEGPPGGVGRRGRSRPPGLTSRAGSGRSSPESRRKPKGLAHPSRGERQQPQGGRRLVPARRALRGDGRERVGQEHAGRGDAPPGPGEA